MRTRIGVISDTHGLLRPEVIEALEGCAVILHGGDINRREILTRLEEIAPLIVVRGNNDREWAEHIPYTVETEIEGLRICMAHKKSDLPYDLSPYGLVVCGHTHRYEERQQPSGILLNPGSCGPRRFHQEITLAVVTVSDGKIEEIQKILIPNEKPQSEKKPISGGRNRNRDTTVANDKKQGPVMAADMHAVITCVTGDIERGRPVAEIARRRHLDPDLVEQICRLYLTHPGVDADGIMTKMGL